MGKKKLAFQIIKLNEEEICFDMINGDYPLANAIRRIMLAEVPTMAIEKIHLFNNTSEMPDFALCQRLALVPIKADARHFQEYQPNDEHTEQNSIKMELNVKCPIDHKGIMNVYSESIRCGVGTDTGSSYRLDKHQSIEPVDKDILLMKLAPGQQIDATLYCHKGIGKDHAKYCPVAACYYSCPTIFHFNDQYDLTPEELELLRLYFPKGLLDLDNLDEKGYPTILNNRFPRSDFLLQTCGSTLRQKILFERNNNVLAFTVESIGIMPACQLVIESIDILKTKCTRFLKCIMQHIQ